MSTIENRSRFTVSVANRGDLFKTFPRDKKALAIAYAQHLSTTFGLKPKLGRENDNFLVRFRDLGHLGP